MNAEGYVSDVIYTSHFFREQCPGVLNEVRRWRGVAAVPLDREFSWCDLGCGTGYTAALLAAAHPRGTFWGVDFLPEHIAEARQTAEGLSNVHFVEAGFEAFLVMAQEQGLTFDFITLHGVMSYVRESTRTLIQQMVAVLLKPGGTLYVGYNAQPGWAATAPVQYLLRTLASRTEIGDSATRLAAAAQTAATLEAAGAAYFQQVPAAGERVRAVLAADSSYPVHEYMSEQWHAFHHAEMAAYFQSPERRYLGSAKIAENFPQHLLPPAQWGLLKAETDPACQEMLRDFLMNTTFRRDVFGPVSPVLSAAEQEEADAVLRLCLATPPAAWRGSLRTPAGRVDPDLSGCFRSASEWGARSPQLGDCARLAGRPLAAIYAAASFLVQTGQAFWWTGPDADPAAAWQFNRRMVQRVMEGRSAEAFALPGCGTGVMTDLLERLALQGFLMEKRTSVESLTNFIEEMARRLGRTLRCRDEVLETRTARLDLLGPFAERFIHGRWPQMQRWRLFGEAAP